MKNGQGFILNMDQTPVFFCMTRKKTLEVIGVKTVHIRTSTNDTKRATVAVTIAADGSKFFGGGGDKNITINHGCGGSDCGGGGNSSGDDGGDGGDGGGREIDGGVGCGRSLFLIGAVRRKGYENKPVPNRNKSSTHHLQYT